MKMFSDLHKRLGGFCPASEGNIINQKDRDVPPWQPEQSPGQHWLGSCGNMMLCLLPLCQARDTQQGSVQYWHWHEQQRETAARQDKLGN